MPERVKGPCLLNVVPGGKIAVLNLRDAERMGYKLAILPGVMIQATIGAGDAALASIKATLQVAPASEGVVQTFRRFGADEWGALRERFASAAPSDKKKEVA